MNTTVYRALTFNSRHRKRSSSLLKVLTGLQWVHTQQFKNAADILLPFSSLMHINPHNFFSTTYTRNPQSAGGTPPTRAPRDLDA
jgi:hypothetical protein